MQPEHYLRVRAVANALAVASHSKLPRTICRRIFARAQAEVEISDFNGSQRMLLDLSEHMQRRIFWMGHYSRDVVATLQWLLRPGMHFVDIGANVGEITLTAGKIVGASGSVTAFEPVDAIASKLAQHLLWNDLSWCRLERLALSDHRGSAEIFASTGNNGTWDPHDGLASLHNIGRSRVPVQQVRLDTLDHYLSDHPASVIDGIKIDIEGAELECLRGAEATLRRFQPWLVVEVQSQTSAAAGYEQRYILDFLASVGYEFYRTGSAQPHAISTDDLSAIQNVLCLHQARHTNLIA